jgi:hypothetical protein
VRMFSKIQISNISHMACSISLLSRISQNSTRSAIFAITHFLGCSKQLNLDEL